MVCGSEGFLGGEMKKIITVLFLIPVLVLMGTGDASTPGVFTLAD
jgi:hypothetical protein